MIFMLFHGSFGSPDENWYPQLKAQLDLLGQTVVIPQFPVDSWDDLKNTGQSYVMKHQILSNWLATIGQEIKSLPKNEKICFIGHSLGPLFILHVAEKYGIKLDCAIFVSPFLDKLDRWEFNLANASFYRTDFDFEKLKRLIPVSYVLYSDNDPYVSRNHSVLFAKAMDSSLIMVRKAGHMNSAVNLNEFPLVLDLCMTRLDLSLYQQYLVHRRKLGAQEYITAAKDRGIIRLKPDDVIDEGVFHFTHLTRSGFCTLFTGFKDYWDPTSDYMEQARIAVRRVPDFTRVIILDKPDDLKDNRILTQIKLDYSAGISIYLLLYSEVKDIVIEPDFGIWDDEYVCVVRYDTQKKSISEVELNSRSADIKQYSVWKDIILRKATKISNPEPDVDLYYNSHKS